MAEEAIETGSNTYILLTGQNNCAYEDHFYAYNGLETMLRAKVKIAQTGLVHDIIPERVGCIIVRQAKQLGLVHTVFCAKRIVGGQFLTDNESGVTADFVQAYASSGKLQLLMV